MSNIDQHRFDNQYRDFVGAREAAEILGVKLPTLYAYVSRGLVRSVRGSQGRARRYARADVERLAARRDARRGHGPVAAGALRWGEPVLDSAITEITTDGHAYRGHPAVALAGDRVPFEAVADLLWTGSLPARSDADRWRAPAPRFPAAALAALLPGDAPPVARLAAAIPILGARDPLRTAAPDRELERARALVRALPRALGGPERPRVAAAVAGALGARGARRIEAVDAALVIVADHELNASAFAARVAASAGADLYACVSAGLAALSGPEHGGMCDRVEAMIAAIGAPRAAAAAIRGRLSRGEPVWGFGHPLYPGGDPRGRYLLARARAMAPRTPAVRTADAVVRAMARAGQPGPTLDVGLVAITAALRCRPGAAAAVFACGRIAGWIAHVLEQRDAGFLLRPRARYVGPVTKSTFTVDART